MPGTLAGRWPLALVVVLALVLVVRARARKPDSYLVAPYFDLSGGERGNPYAMSEDPSLPSPYGPALERFSGGEPYNIQLYDNPYKYPWYTGREVTAWDGDRRCVSYNSRFPSAVWCR